MAETLTYNESQPTESSEVTLNEAEQEALEVGEQMEKEQGNALLAGKYSSPEQLEKAYLELQSKLGSKSDDPGEEEVGYEDDDTTSDEEDGGEEYEYDSSFLDQLYEQAQGEPSEEFVEQLQNMDVGDLADMYVQYRQGVEEQLSQNQDFTEEQTEALYGIVGGREEYAQLTSWASENLSQEEVAMFDAVMDQGDANAAYWAIRGLAMQYVDAVGYEGKRISGKAPRSSDTQFRSQAELVQAMSDPRYENDDAYRNDVLDKLSRSNIDF